MVWQIDDESAYVLHTLPYRGSSLIGEVLTENHGRVKLLALSARGPKSRFRGVFRTFSLLKISARGRSELRKVSQATCINSIIDLPSIAMFCGYYMHELMRYCLPLEEPATALFLTYQSILQQLATASQMELEQYLRQFEKILLEHCGYGIDFQHDAKTGATIDENLHYQFIVGEGFIEQANGNALIPGYIVQKIFLSEWNHEVANYAKFIFRQAIGQYLHGKTLVTRDLLKSFL